MSSRKRKLRHSTTSNGPHKRRRTNKPLRRSSRLHAMQKNKRAHIETINIPESLRRSSRIQQKLIKSTMQQIHENNDPNDSGNDIHEIENERLSSHRNASKPHQTPPKYEPLPPPTHRKHFNPSNDYTSLQHRMELGLISSSDLRNIIHENELNDFWNDVTSNRYSLQSIEPIFADSQSTDKKISAFTLHNSELFAFSGTKDGYIGITNFSQIPYQTIANRCHSNKITDIHTSIKRPLHLYTSGFDGKVKILDLMRINNNNGYFGDTVIDTDGAVIHGFDIKNGGREVYGVDHDGVLLCCDIRTHTNYQYEIAEKKIPTIRIHPLNDNYFVITENKYKTLQLWDFRCIKQNKMSFIHQNNCERVLMTLNFSYNGDRLLTCGRDDYIRVYDNPLNTFKEDVMNMKHKNNTGIWICDYKPIFHPKHSEIILTGNLDYKGIDVLYFGKDHKMKSYNIHDLSKTRGVHTFGAVHRKYNDYLFGVTYDKLVFYANIPCHNIL